jgi:glycerol-3-phosphate dehydrogenase
VKSIHCEVTIIGGGSAGTGLARDLAMRGFKVVLLEKGDFSQGTTGRYHGLLHSGGRYAVKDPAAARECIQENRILRKIMPFCIEDTGGYFVLTPWDDPQYPDLFLKGCKAAGIPVEEIPISRMLKAEPSLNRNILRCFQVPDGSADSFLASEANIYSAKSYGAQIFTYHPVIAFDKNNYQINKVICLDIANNNEEVHVESEFVVNASGAWAGKIARLAQIQVDMLPGKGTMLALNHRIVQKVINRCKMPSDGDIIVPVHDVAILGTTDVPVQDPDHYGIDPWEIKLIIEEAEKMLPGIQELRFLRAWAGVRPLYREEKPSNDRDVSRGYVLLDHEQRDGLTNFITITGGKWTTYRKMAEVTADLISQKFKRSTTCRTHREILENPFNRRARSYFNPGERLREIEAQKKFAELVCECELVTKDEIVQSIHLGNPKSLDDLRRETRVGMGPCQGGFCTLRTAGILQQETGEEAKKINQAIQDFVQERRKGIQPILWGKQLQQEWLDDLIFSSLLNINQLQGTETSPFSSPAYAPSKSEKIQPPDPITRSPAQPQIHHINLQKFPASRKITNTFDIVVIGGGLAGLTAAWRLLNKGANVCVVTKGRGSLLFHAGCVDLLGRLPGTKQGSIHSPQLTLPMIKNSHPSHPYTWLGLEYLKMALSQFADLCSRHEYPLKGNTHENWLLPSSSGALRTSAYAPVTMINGDMRSTDSALILGFQGFLDFHPRLIAENLNGIGIKTRYAFLDPGHSQQVISPIRLSNWFDDPEFLKWIRGEISRILRGVEYKGLNRVGLPAVLGVNHAVQNQNDISSAIGLPVFEIPGLPPSIPGIRLHRILTNEIKKLNGRIIEGSQVSQARITAQKVECVYTEAAARHNSFYADHYILATGGILGGGFSRQFTGEVRELVFDLPVTIPPESQAQGIYRRLQLAGIQVNQQFQPILENGETCLENVWCVGTCLYQSDPIMTGSMEGISIATGFAVGEALN